MITNNIHNLPDSSEITEVKLEFDNIAGQSNSVIITYTELEKAFLQGIQVDASDIVGLTGICENEFVLWPDFASKRTYQINEKKIQFVFNCKVTTIDGTDVKDIKNELITASLQEAKILGLNNMGDHKLFGLFFPKTKVKTLHFAS